MERRDIIIDEIERLGQVLGLILMRLTSKNAKLEKSENYVQEQFSEQLRIDFNMLKQMNDDQLIRYLIDEKKLLLENLDQISQIFENLAQGAESKRMLLKALLLLEHAHVHDTTYSLEREERIKSLRRQLEVK